MSLFKVLTLTVFTTCRAVSQWINKFPSNPGHCESILLEGVGDFTLGGLDRVDRLLLLAVLSLSIDSLFMLQGSDVGFSPSGSESWSFPALRLLVGTASPASSGGVVLLQSLSCSDTQKWWSGSPPSCPLTTCMSVQVMVEGKHRTESGGIGTSTTIVLCLV